MGSEDSPTPTILPPSDLNQVSTTTTIIKSETMDTTTTPSQTGGGEGIATIYKYLKNNLKVN
jgi:hypothetical protein